MPRRSLLLVHACRRARHFAQSASRFARDETGATMAEYALLIGVIALVALAGAKAFGTTLNTKLANEAARIANP